ncbi:MAG: phosphohistidine phosphatase SixA [Chloroflexi bacterium HGW-Chloroflexi-1]|nr:MAG: phosphohistidine phosphatase SixA [Chloroflexi bacterium HGW-Chloroflexi-1]
MKLYLVQHADALPESVDPARPLSEQGRADAGRMAALAARLGLEVAQIRHSGKTRAEQTAAIFGQALKPAGGVVAVAGLGPKDDVRPVAKALEREAQPVMLVSHLPFLERLAGLLLAGDPDRPAVQFCKAGIVCLVREADRWRVAWAITPELTQGWAP